VGHNANKQTRLFVYSPDNFVDFLDDLIVSEIVDCFGLEPEQLERLLQLLLVLLRSIPGLQLVTAGRKQMLLKSQGEHQSLIRRSTHLKLFVDLGVEIFLVYDQAKSWILWINLVLVVVAYVDCVVGADRGLI
jgi:hypothetical protein